MKLKNVLIAVNDVEQSRQFYNMTDSLLEGISAFVESKTGAEMMEETKEIR